MATYVCDWEICLDDTDVSAHIRNFHGTLLLLRPRTDPTTMSIVTQYQAKNRMIIFDAFFYTLQIPDTKRE